MQEVLEKNKCTGCTACLNICPKKAITFVEEKDGFKYPKIDQSKCIDCGLCKKTCPVLNKKSNESINECYVGYSKETEDRLSSSSGGLFSVIANYVLDNKGIVVGAAFDNENKLKHIAIEKKEELEVLKKSKYLQSDLGSIFTDIKKSLKKRKVLFVGTPCQVAGIKSFIGENENLITIDFVCHGVPSPKLFEKYISELEEKNNDKLINYDFRDNSSGWDTYSNKAKFENKTVTTLSSKNEYMKLFLSDIALRESCYNCNFKLGNKYSDITLGDFWGVKNFYPEMYNKEGVSAIIINTELGKKVFENIEKNVSNKECKIENIIKGNPSLVSSSKRPKERDVFFKELENESIENLSKKYKKKDSAMLKIKRAIKKIIK